MKHSKIQGKQGGLPFTAPEPEDNERPTRYAERLGEIYCLKSTAEQRKKSGQYFTPIEIADFMAGHIKAKRGSVKVVDAGAGAGILGCAVCERLANQGKKPSHIKLVTYESDEKLFKLLDKTIEYLKQYIENKNISFEALIEKEDFVLRYAHHIGKEPTFFQKADSNDKFDICISNPPYFKLPKKDPRSVAASKVVHGQPNIYSLFMAVAASILKNNGELVFITPRSFTSGYYFKLFREKLFEMVEPEFVHLFHSRKDAFKKDKVLQENIIFKARRKADWQSHIEGQDIVISSSDGIKDIEESSEKTIPLVRVLDLKSKNKILKIPAEGWGEISDKFDSWNNSLNECELKISTGPVVAFRAKKFIPEKRSSGKTYVPLLWLNNVKVMEISWPLHKIRKPQYIEKSPESFPLLIPNGNYVLLRRFSAKEETRRLVAAPFIREYYPYDMIGFENHINYIYRPKGILTQQEAWGLSVLYNCSYYDKYFRGFNGNTQVGATEISYLPLPPKDIINEIGKKAMSSANIIEDLEQLAELAFCDIKHSKRIYINV